MSALSANLLLFGCHRLTRDLLAEHLRGSMPFLKVNVNQSDRLPLKLSEQSVDLALFVALAMPAADIMVEAQKFAFGLPSCPLAVVSDREDSSFISSLLRVGVKGFIPSSMGVDAVAPALSVLLSGGDYLPRSAFLSAQNAPAKPASVSMALNASRLSQREKQIVALLMKGKQNKAIASELNMQEGTVKAHLRNLMRKVGVRNRLEAVLTFVREEDAASNLSEVS